MPLYLVPEVPASASEFRELISRSGIKFVESDKLYPVIAAAQENDNVIAAVPTFQVHILCRYMDLMVTTVPTVIRVAPAIPYPTDWLVYTQPLVQIDWMEASSAFAKSGLLAQTPSQVAERQKNVPDRQKRASAMPSVVNKRTSAASPADELKAPAALAGISSVSDEPDM